MMVPDFVPLYAVVILLFCLLYFSFASIPFLFVPLQVPEVARLFRGLFSVYFRLVAGAGFLAGAAFAASGRLGFMVGMLLLAIIALFMRGWTLQRIDSQQDAFRSGNGAAMRRLRMVHWGGMGANLAAIATVCGSVPYIL